MMHWRAPSGTSTTTYPSGKVVAYQYDDAGRPKAAGLTNVGATQYLKSLDIAYAPHGAPTTWKLGNGVVETTTYNNRLRPLTINATKSSSLLTLTFGYGTTANNGNVLSQQIEAPGSPSAINATQYYRYDALNRLGIVAEGVSRPGRTPVPRRPEPGAATSATTPTATALSRAASTG